MLRVFLKIAQRIFATVVFAAVVSGCGLSGYGAVESEPKLPVYYNVKEGDTIWTISKHYGVSHDSILLLNGIDDATSLRQGTRLLVGYRYRKSAPARVTSASLKSKQSSPRQYPAVNKQSSEHGGELLWPVSTGHVVSGFGPRSGTFHDGIDVSCPEGTPVYAAHAGTVIYAGDKISGYGNLLVVRHDTGLTTIYAHNSELLVESGDRIKRGQNISEVGSTGHASGPHLHFEVRMRDSQGRYVAVDPLPLLTGEPDARLRYRVNETLTPILSRLFN